MRTKGSGEERGDLLAPLRLAVERASLEAKYAERRYMAVDPDNRLIARTLEADWEKALRKLEIARAELALAANASNTWIVDLRHYLTPAGALAPMPSRARLLAEYFARIVVDATTNLDDPPSVRCRRRPGHRRCRGVVMSFPAADEGDSIYWYCLVCDDKGVIRGWQNTLWDGFAATNSSQ